MIDIDNLGKRMPEPEPPAQSGRLWSILQWCPLGLLLLLIVAARFCSWTVETPPMNSVGNGEVREIPDRRSGATFQIGPPTSLDSVDLVGIHPTGRPGIPCSDEDFGAPPGGGRRMFGETEVHFAVDGWKYVMAFQGAPLPGKPGRIEVRYDKPWAIGWRKLNGWAIMVICGGLYFYGRMLPALIRSDRWSGNLPP